MAVTNLAIVQARMSSTRLPGKVLEEIAGETVLERVVGRVRRAAAIDHVVVATSEMSADDPIQAACESLGVGVFRGSESDVLDRFVGACRADDPRWVVRINADNPFIAPEFLDALLGATAVGGTDYASYRVGDRPAMLTPVGLFAEVLSRECLERAAATLHERAHREHVTLGVYTSENDFAVRWLEAPSYACGGGLRLTLDTADDLALLRDVAEQTDPELGAEQLCQTIAAHPEWVAEMRGLNAAQPK